MIPKHKHQNSSKYCDDNHSGASCVSLVPIFNHLEEDQMNEIMQAVRHVNYKKNELVYRAGEKSDTLYIVRRGRIKLYRLSESDRKSVV